MQQTIHREIKRNILLNPGPATTSEAVKAALVVSDICPREAEFGAVLKNVLELCVDVVAPKSVREDYRCVLMGSSGTGALEAVISSVVGAHDKLLILENGAYGSRLAQIASAYQIPHEVFKVTWGDPLKRKEVEDLLETRAHDFTHLAFIHHETTSGILNDLNWFSALCKTHSLSGIVDAMSSYAGIIINLAQTPVDYLISSSNKCLQGMAGLGIVIAKYEKLLALKEKKTHNYYFNLYQNFTSQTFKGQFLFTPPVQILYALHAALLEFFHEGIDGRAKRYSDLYEQMLAGMIELGFSPLAAKEDHARILTAFLEPNHPRYHFDKMHDYLYQRGITIYPGKGVKESTFRVSNIGELKKSDIEFFLEVMRDYLHLEGIEL